jgi:chemotaxis protein CheX
MSAIKSEIKDKINFIYLPPDLDATAVKQIAVLSNEWAVLKVDAHVLDFQHVQDISGQSYRSFIALKKSFSATDTKLFSIHVKENIRRQIKNDGLDSVFGVESSLDIVFEKIGRKKAQSSNGFNVEFITPFIGAVQVAIKVQANTPLTGEPPFAKKAPHPDNIAIAGVINLVSDQFIGSISLLFPEKVFLLIYSNMFGEKCEKITKESEDAAGELLNIIFGLAKAKLNNEKGYTVQKAIPTVLVGEKLQIATSHVGSTVVLPFTTDAGRFYVEVNFEKT